MTLGYKSKLILLTTIKDYVNGMLSKKEKMHERDGGKGDKPRPIPNREQFEKNFDLIFKRKEKQNGNKTKPDEENND